MERETDPVEAGTPSRLQELALVRAFEPLSSFVSPAPRRNRRSDPGRGVRRAAVRRPDGRRCRVRDGAPRDACGARRRWRHVPAMVAIWPVGALMAISTIGFGLLFGEWFGDLGTRLFGSMPLWFDRREAVTTRCSLLALGDRRRPGRLRARARDRQRDQAAPSPGGVRSNGPPRQPRGHGRHVAAAAGFLPESVGQLGVVALLAGLVILAERSGWAARSR